MDEKELKIIMKQLIDYIKTNETVCLSIENQTELVKEELTKLLGFEIQDIRTQYEDNVSKISIEINDSYYGALPPIMYKEGYTEVKFYEPVEIDIFISHLKGSMFLIAKGFAAFNYADEDDGYSADYFELGSKKAKIPVKSVSVKKIKEGMDSIASIFEIYSMESMLYSINHNNRCLESKIINEMLDISPNIAKYGFCNSINFSSTEDEVCIKFDFINKFKGIITSIQNEYSEKVSINNTVKFMTEIKVKEDLVSINVDGYSPKTSNNDEINFNLINEKIKIDNKYMNRESFDDRLKKIELEFSNQTKSDIECINTLEEMLVSEINKDRQDEIKEVLSKVKFIHSLELND